MFCLVHLHICSFSLLFSSLTYINPFFSNFLIYANGGSTVQKKEAHRNWIPMATCGILHLNPTIHTHTHTEGERELLLRDPVCDCWIQYNGHHFFFFSNFWTWAYHAQKFKSKYNGQTNSPRAGSKTLCAAFLFEAKLLAEASKIFWRLWGTRRSLWT